MTDQPDTNPEDETPTPPESDLEELAELGLPLAPPDHWVYRQGDVFFIPDQVDDIDNDQPSMDEVLDRLGVGRNRVPPDDPIFSSGAWVLFPKGEQHLVDQPDMDEDQPDGLR